MFGNKKKNTIVIASPLDGDVTPVSQLSDPVFSDDVLGRGIAIKPSSGDVLAPAGATISLMFNTGHAVSLITDDGVELLIHIGIDTVKLKGRHFKIHKNNNDQVKAGDILIEFDIASIIGEGYDISTPVVICNPDEYKKISFAPQGPIKAGEPLITLMPQ
ncbi:MAG: PTS glucose transporter subunit IIA [Oscillospiraceae bacterium]|nr:PTS glucose transporter subunit IIA [Oscillospiraceae bacterium]